MEQAINKTYFASVYNRFLSKITDDMYMELTPQDTIKDLQNLLINAIPGFEFPRKSLDYTIFVREIRNSTSGIYGFFIENSYGNGYEDASYFHSILSSEEIDILAILMMNGWLQRQITTIENIRMKYSGTDFKMTSQANHLAKLLTLLKETQRQSLHAQRLYKRRRVDANGKIRSNWDIFKEDSAITGHKDIDEKDIYDATVISTVLNTENINETRPGEILKETILDGG